MFPFHLNQASTTVNYMAEFQDDNQGHHRPSLTTAASGAPPLSCPSLFNIFHDQGDHEDLRRHQQKEANGQTFNGATSRYRLISRPQEDYDYGRNLKLSKDYDYGRNLKLSLCDQYVKEEEVGGERINTQWMSSKMRIMGKIMNADHTMESRTRKQTRSSHDRSSGANQVSGMRDGNIARSGGDVFRVCSDCHTTKTPLWRSGPCGPKSLCNACGIRQRKARRAMAATAESSANGSRLMPSPPAAPKARKEKKTHRTVLFKKPCKFPAAEMARQPKLCFEDVTLTLGTSSASPSAQRPFQQEERDAAILLMTLSYGLIRS